MLVVNEKEIQCQDNFALSLKDGDSSKTEAGSYKCIPYYSRTHSKDYTMLMDLVNVTQIINYIVKPFKVKERTIPKVVLMCFMLMLVFSAFCFFALYFCSKQDNKKILLKEI